jgi:hypothetical protein
LKCAGWAMVVSKTLTKNVTAPIWIKVLVFLHLYKRTRVEATNATH